MNERPSAVFTVTWAPVAGEPGAGSVPATGAWSRVSRSPRYAPEEGLWFW